MAQTGNNQNDATRERLLDAAEKLFAKNGYDSVGVREITSAAGSNLAAVNYHFGSKENLYMEVFHERWRARAQMILQPLTELGQQQNITPTQVVETMARCFLEGPLTADERLRHAQLIARELATPGKAFQLLAEGVLKPTLIHGASLLRRALPHPMPKERLRLIILSIFAQVIYFNFARPVVSLVAEREYDAEFIEQIIKHITEFALHGLDLEDGA